MKRLFLVLFLFSSFFSMFAQEYTLETVKQNGKSMQIKRDKITNSPHRIFGLQDKADNLGINFEKNIAD